MKKQNTPDLLSFSDASKKFKVPIHQLYYHKNNDEELKKLGFSLYKVGKVNLLIKL